LPQSGNYKLVSRKRPADAGNRKVKWGPFFDHNVRPLSYEVTGADSTYTISGAGSFDGTSWPTVEDSVVEIIPEPSFLLVALAAIHFLRNKRPKIYV